MDLKDSNATEKYGEQLGRNLRGGEVIELISDLGGGKTTLVRGIALGAGSSDVVSSPTFTISKIYKADKFDIYHYDFYRLTEPGIIQHEIIDALADSRAVVVIEWGGIVGNILPADRLTIKLDKTDNDHRTAVGTYPKDRAYIMEKV